VNYVSAKEGQSLYEGASILTLKDIPYSAEYRSLAAQHRGYEEQLLELFELYQTLTLTAPCDGVVSGIDENSAQLLKAEEGWSVSLLKNAPGADPEAEYINFVGWVKAQGSDGYIIALDPTLFSHTDYADLSGLPRDTSAMIHEAVYTGGAPVYRWDGESWQESGFAVGDLLLFGGDSSGRVVWVIPYGHAEVPGEGGGEGEEPGGENPGGETPGGENPGGETPGGETPGGETPGGETPGGENPGGSGGGWPSGGSMPSFGGSGGGWPSGAATQEETVTVPEEVTVASVTPQDTVTLEMPVDELDLHLVRVGQEAWVTLEALGSTFPATVTAIGRTGINGGGSSKFSATVTIARDERMLPGMNASVIIPLETVSGIAIPVAALQSYRSGSVVCTALDPETGLPDHPVEVTLSASDGEYVLVEGIPEGTQIWYTYYEALE